MSNEESLNPYEQHWEEILDYCYSCCYDELTGCVPDEMCPGCECQSICMDYVDYYGDHEYVFNDCRYYDDCEAYF